MGVVFRPVPRVSRRADSAVAFSARSRDPGGAPGGVSRPSPRTAECQVRVDRRAPRPGCPRSWRRLISSPRYRRAGAETRIIARPGLYRPLHRGLGGSGKADAGPLSGSRFPLQSSAMGSTRPLLSAHQPRTPRPLTGHTTGDRPDRRTPRPAEGARIPPCGRRRLPEADFVFAGQGPERRRLEAMAMALGVSDRVRFLGHRRDVPDLLAACDVFVLPSLYEGLPLSVLEAMAAGKPVVATASAARMKPSSTALGPAGAAGEPPPC